MSTNQIGAINSELLKEKAQLASQIDTMFHMDVRMENLKSYLQNISNVVNQQSVIINQLQAEMKTKITEDRVEKALKTVSTVIEINDAELQKKVSALVDKPKVENTGDAIMDGANMICNKIVYLGQACSLIYKGNKDWERKLQAVENELPKKITRDVVKEKVSKIKKKLLNEIEEFKKKCQKQIDDSNKRVDSSLGKMEITVKDTEKKTLWKISDCEALLQKRITADYVDNTAKSLEEKLRREIQKVKEESFGEVFHKIDLLNDKCKNLDDQIQEKQKSLKKLIKDLEDDLLGKFCSTDKFETNKKTVQDRLIELDNKISLLDRRGSAVDLGEKLAKQLKELEEKIFALQREDGHLRNSIQDLTVKLELVGKSIPEDTGDKGEGFSLSDPHKLCAIESEVKRHKDEISDLRRILSNSDHDLRRKFDALEHKVLSQFNNAQRLQEQSGISKEDAITMIERAKIILEERIKALGSDVEDLKGKLGIINELDKKIKKKFRELQEGNGGGDLDWQKKIDLKADGEDTKKEFLLVDEKIKNIIEVVNQFRREFETIEEFYMQLAQMLKTNQQEAISIITGNSKIIPNRCVACGTKGRQQYHSQDMKGIDGRIYRADFGSQHQTSVYETQEVFDVLPSTLGLPAINVTDEKFNKSQLTTKQSVVSFKGRPTSAKSDQNSVQQSFISQKGVNQKKY
ncbi:hypothetical protein ABPG72_002976 [Tetrahymena utriculariae]